MMARLEAEVQAGAIQENEPEFEVLPIDTQVIVTSEDCRSYGKQVVIKKTDAKTGYHWGLPMVVTDPEYIRQNVLMGPYCLRNLEVVVTKEGQKVSKRKPIEPVTPEPEIQPAPETPPVAKSEPSTTASGMKRVPRAPKKPAVTFADRWKV